MSKGNNDNSSGKISLIVAIIIGMNAMIGAGVVALPALLATKVGPAGVLSVLLCVVTVIFIGLALGHVADLYPGEGWVYSYPSKWGGHAMGMISASLYLFGVFGGMGFVLQQSGIWGNRLLPFLSPSFIVVAILIILTILVLAGAAVSSVGQYIIAAFVLIPLIITGIVCGFNFKVELITTSFMPYGFSSVLVGFSVVIFSLLGFESIISLYPIIKNPKKNVPKACVLSIVGIGLLYLIFISGILFSIPAAHFSGGVSDTLSNVLLKEFPHFKVLAWFILIGALFGIIGTLHSMLWSVSELFTDVLKKAKSKVIKNALAKKMWTNNTSIIATSLIMLIMSLFIHGEDLVYMTVLFMVPANVFSIMLLLFIKKEWKSGRNIKTILALGGCSVIVYYSGKHVLSLLIKVFHSIAGWF